MKNFYKILMIFIISSVNIHSQTVTEEWVARYNGPGDSSDNARAIVLDGSDNVYVTGSSEGSGTGTDYATIKYNSNGIQQWVARYNGPGNGNDGANAIAVDGSGNVYVTGGSYGNGTDWDYATIKYNANGVQQWEASYNGTGNGWDVANSIALDGSGNVYVTGSSIGSGTNRGCATIKYNSNGALQWVARYDGTGGFDEAYKIVVDASDNVYITGLSVGSGTGSDYVTIKYNSNGEQQWVGRYNGPGNGFDRANALVLDNMGNVYVTGSSLGIGTGWDYATIKYNSNGVEQWVARYNGPGNDLDAASAITVDGSGSVYVTGGSYGNGTFDDYATIKYNSNGVQQWVARYNGPVNSFDWGKAITLDGLGNVYVAGDSYGSGTYEDYATIKYNSNGVQQWVARYNGPGNNTDRTNAIALDGSGNVYVTGESFGIGTVTDYATVKYSHVLNINTISSHTHESISLHQNFPNPFNPTTNIRFDIQKQGLVSLKVYDILGKKVATLVNESLSAGTYEANFEASGLTSGVYFYHLETEGFSDVKRMILLK